jgi:hypothetical protein
VGSSFGGCDDHAAEARAWSDTLNLACQQGLTWLEHSASPCTSRDVREAQGLGWLLTHNTADFAHFGAIITVEPLLTTP